LLDVISGAAMGESAAIGRGHQTLRASPSAEGFRQTAGLRSSASASDDASPVPSGAGAAL
jgi:hypothetical protein